MEILTLEQLVEWVAIDPGTDTVTLTMLESSAIDVVEHCTGRTIRPYYDADNNHIAPPVPQSLKHAIAVLVHAGYDQRTGADDATMKAVTRLCLPWRVMSL